MNLNVYKTEFFFFYIFSVYSFVDCGCRRSGRYHASLNGLITTYDVARRRPTVKKDYQLLEDSENNKIVACGRNVSHQNFILFNLILILL